MRPFTLHLESLADDRRLGTVLAGAVFVGSLD